MCFPVVQSFEVSIVLRALDAKYGITQLCEGVNDGIRRCDPRLRYNPEIRGCPDAPAR